jgi:hypothetical protein
MESEKRDRFGFGSDVDPVIWLWNTWARRPLQCNGGVDVI